MLGQDRHEAILRSHLEKLGCSVELGTELQSFEADSDHVIAHITTSTPDGKATQATIDVRWLVGADGAHSIVRKKLGLSFLGDTIDSERMIVGDIRVNNLSREVVSCMLDYFYGVSCMLPSSGTCGETIHQSCTSNSPHQSFHAYSSTYRIVLIPSETPNDDRFSFLMSGHQLDVEAVGVKREGIINRITSYTGKDDFEFGELIWSSVWVIAYILNETQLADQHMLLLHTFHRKPTYEWSILSAKAVFLLLEVGPLWPYYDLALIATPIDSAHVHSPTGGQVCCALS